jgi:acetyl-CoA/propionyl-CoA carboxylase biotin carboxyl carrier protein
LAAPEFTDAFTVHTTWVDTDFAATVAGLAPAQVPNAVPPEAEATARLVVEVDGKRLEVVLPAALAAPAQPASATPRRAGRKAAGPAASPGGAGQVTAPMQGTVVRVAVKEGQVVAQGDLLVVLEAMKMEQPLSAPCAGVVMGLNATAGERVSAGHVLCTVVPAPADH